MVINNLTTNDMSLDPWLGCEERAEYEWAQELNGRQVLFECSHGRYWYLDDQVLTQVQHVYPLETIPVYPCPSIRLADLLARVRHVVSRTPGDYLEFVQTQLQGCMAGIPITLVASFLSKVNLHHVLHFLYSLFQLF
ncbi:uncharacterized protein LOC115984347 isoform X2 [Quercus lobata]|uniref:uncharacterized protein LOC115984347 isoform X2 n=1 Tax=Quercus lobata TaxID=97700 RepID=UPI0012446ACE|nr:uncharacterized protein LOC115984347 isoform X2 [Quercus lobata]